MNKHWRYEPNKSAINCRSKSYFKDYDIYTIRGVATTFWVNPDGEIFTTGKTGKKTELHIDEIRRHIANKNLKKNG